MGGAGKTQVIEHIAKTLMGFGVNVSVLCHAYRGYSKSLKVPIRLPKSLTFGELQFGDEALMLSQSLPDRCALWVGGQWRERWRAALEDKPDLILADGGFFCHELPRDLGIYLIPSPRKNTLFPFGDLSRPSSAWPSGHGYQRWTFLRGFTAQPLEEVDSDVRDRVVQIKPLMWINSQGEERSLSMVQGRSVGVFTAIARPQDFIDIATDLGAVIIKQFMLRDHSPCPLSLIHELHSQPHILWLTTKKDLVKIPQPYSKKVWALSTTLV